MYLHTPTHTHAQMYVCMYVYMYAYTYIHEHAYMHVPIHAHAFSHRPIPRHSLPLSCAHVHALTCMYAEYMSFWAHKRTHTHTDTHIYTRAKYTHFSIHAYAHTDMCTNEYISLCPRLRHVCMHVTAQPDQLTSPGIMRLLPVMATRKHATTHMRASLSGPKLWSFAVYKMPTPRPHKILALSPHCQNKTQPPYIQQACARTHTSPNTHRCLTSTASSSATVWS